MLEPEVPGFSLPHGTWFQTREMITQMRNRFLLYSWIDILNGQEPITHTVISELEAVKPRTISSEVNAVLLTSITFKELPSGSTISILRMFHINILKFYRLILT